MLSVTPSPDSLPPSSVQTFLRGRIPPHGLVLANHNKEYRNPYYNSIYDNASNILYKYYNGSLVPEDSVQKYVADVATMVAKSVYEEVVNEKNTGDA